MTSTKTDTELQRDVQDELKWEPSIDAAEIGVIVSDGVVTLTGSTNSYYQKRTAERAAKRVSGVKAVTNEIEVKFLTAFKGHTDADIARSAVNSLELRGSIPEDRIKVKVENGWVTLEGEVDWYYQKTMAEDAVEDLAGVRGVINLIKLKPKVTVKEVKTEIVDSFKRHAAQDAGNIQVDVHNGKVTLKGEVPSWDERTYAEWAAWMTPGVNEVQNQVAVIPKT